MVRRDSYKDREFVERLAARLKLPCIAARINVPLLSRRGSLEEVARDARIGFLCNIARRLKADRIALGHNLDDQAETVLMRILRGTGLYGLSGILPKRPIAGFQFIRPLIEVRRKEIEQFLKRRRIRYRVDTTNFEDIYLRNKVRNRLVPLLEKEYNKNVKTILAGMAASMGFDYDYMQHQAEAALKRMRGRLRLSGLTKLHLALRRMVIRLSIARVKGDLRSITSKHMSEIEDLLLNRPERSIVDLPRGISVKKTKNFLVIYRNRL